MTTTAAAALQAFGSAPDSEGMTQSEHRRVTYSDRHHLSVMLQMHGSVWPSVLRWCLLNVALTLVVYFVREREFVDLTFNPIGHKFMSIIASFLLVSRNKIVLDRFWEARTHLGTCFKSCEELVSFSALLTISDTGAGAKIWRQNISYRAILLLRVTIASLEYKNSGIAPWRVSEMPKDEQAEFDNLFPALSGSQKGRLLRRNEHTRWAHNEENSLSYDALRPPLVLAYTVREQIMSFKNGDTLTTPLRLPEELRLLDQVSAFMKAYHSLIKLIAAPVPFPWVQMARTFTFFWLFTLPFALCHQAVSAFTVSLCVFFTTYGFLGLVHVTIELDDPFGDDPNDFDDLQMARNVVEMIYIINYKVDGADSAAELQRRVSGEHPLKAVRKA
uniref:Bestrophin homolog n=1 Tax=Odontella aurita TaxID=265563 RepID=A0A7S4IN47_9STRA|mmetsp:Transcript_27678/g.81349  ORF Transcript_27678/g.81349 Transcript_27678/m.81349 type:complete len:388 (+) Transcript_27678:198-1361(+)|eukprot:CAMPEP_0113535892 /NCGR_PEP_ID=MMETSP0015_2-20120614/5959_1 /TAXON_ID=2838 /ORGANISM="Odontella" /LENGTH=387 /DNA_ID=CAMNT_0000435199 /DNA_START=79 /DNA_END=1242 /DNA_ORIENTATION=+ /assembly_acc=CAM_ASM_000160